MVARVRSARRGRRPKIAPKALSRSERRAAVARRRSLVGLGLSVIAVAVILVAWFPAGQLVTQRHTLASTSSTLAELRSEDAALRVESKNLSTPSEIARIARQQFDLVSPGEQAFQVLPPLGKSDSATDPYAGDPGLAPVVSPSAAAELAPGLDASGQVSSTPAAKDTHDAQQASASPGLATRLLHTLEFWR